MSQIQVKQARHQFSVALLCPRCRQRGSETWEENSNPNPRGPESQFITRTDGFYERLKKNEPYAIEVVCRHCEAVMPA